MFSVIAQLTNKNPVPPGPCLVYDAESSAQLTVRHHTRRRGFQFSFCFYRYNFHMKSSRLMTHFSLSLGIKTVCSNTRSLGMAACNGPCQRVSTRPGQTGRGGNNFSLIRNLMHWEAQRSHNIWPELECKQSISALRAWPSPPPHSPEALSQCLEWSIAIRFTPSPAAHGALDSEWWTSAHKASRTWNIALISHPNSHI